MDNGAGRRLQRADHGRLGFWKETEESNCDEDDAGKAEKMEDDVERVSQALHGGVPGFGASAEGGDEADRYEGDQKSPSSKFLT